MMDAQSFKPTEDKITLHGLGFLQVQLPANMRLHVWHPDLPRRRCFAHSSIHDHRFGFTSRVLVGTQVNCVYYDWRGIGEPTHVPYLHEGERTRFGNRPWLPQDPIRIEPDYSESIEAGRIYKMLPYVLHSTEPGGDGRVATLMTKTSDGKTGARSLCAIGVQPDADFDRKQWSPEVLWQIVLDVLGRVPAYRLEGSAT